jgi:hypothetical protein
MLAEVDLERMNQAKPILPRRRLVRLIVGMGIWMSSL